MQSCSHAEAILDHHAYTQWGSTDPQDWYPSSTCSDDETFGRLAWVMTRVSIRSRAAWAPLKQWEIAEQLGITQPAVCFRRRLALHAMTRLTSYPGDLDADIAAVIAMASGEDYDTAEVVRVWAATGRRDHVEGFTPEADPRRQRRVSEALHEWVGDHRNHPIVARLMALHPQYGARRITYAGPDLARWTALDASRSTPAERRLAHTAMPRR